MTAFNNIATFYIFIGTTFFYSLAHNIVFRQMFEKLYFLLNILDTLTLDFYLDE